MKRFIIVILLAISLATVTTGCRHNVNTNNPKVIKVVTLLDAENTVNTISHGLQAANGTLKNMRVSEPEYYADIHPKFVEIARVNELANQKILAAKRGDANVDWKSAVIAVAQVAGDPQSLTSFGFKNPKSKETMELSLATLITGLQLAQQFGGK